MRMQCNKKYVTDGQLEKCYEPTTRANFEFVEKQIMENKYTGFPEIS